MKTFILIFLILVVWSTGALAEQYSSPFGFSMNIPSHWLIVSAEEIRKNPDLFNFNKEIFKNVNPSMLEQIKEMIVSGRVEMFFNQKTGDGSFNDNINVFKRTGQLPQNASESKKACDGLPGQLASAYGKPTKVYSCGTKKVSGLNAVSTEFDGVVEGTRSMTYEIQKSPSIIIVLTATCKNKTLSIIKKEFEDMVTSIKMK
jgi:hypothetical protein